MREGTQGLINSWLSVLSAFCCYWGWAGVGSHFVNHSSVPPCRGGSGAGGRRGDGLHMFHVDFQLRQGNFSEPDSLSDVCLMSRSAVRAVQMERMPIT